MSSAEDFIIEDGVLKGYKGSGGTVVIPEGVTVIGENVFERLDMLTRVVIPEGVTEIKYNAFSECKKTENGGASGYSEGDRSSGLF